MRTLLEQAAAVRNGDVSPTELVQLALTDAARLQGSCNAFTVIDGQRALERARALEVGEPDGPLHGVPIALKDLYDAEGLPTTGCCAAHEEHPRKNSAVTQALLDAGAIILAKTNQHELALGTNSQLSSFGAVRNPWDAGRSPGGSSGGSGAAVAAGVVRMAMGSDTGGSIRIPASFCGTTGLKPTHGAVSLRGLMPLAPSLDTAGPLAVSAADCALVHRIIAAYDAEDPHSAPAGPSRPVGRIAIARSWFRSVHPEVIEAIEEAGRALEETGYVVEEVDGPDPEGARDHIGPLLLSEAAHHFAAILDDERVTEATRQLLGFGASLRAVDGVAASEAVLRLRRSLLTAFEQHDALLVPTTPFPAPALAAVSVDVGTDEVPTDSVGTTRCTIPVNGSGLPAIAFPVGWSSGGLPLSAQLVGRPWSDLELCAVVDTYQGATDHHVRRAPLERQG